MSLSSCSLAFLLFLYKVSKLFWKRRPTSECKVVPLVRELTRSAGFQAGRAHRKRISVVKSCISGRLARRGPGGGNFPA